jgi:hypothetical protein
MNSIFQVAGFAACRPYSLIDEGSPEELSEFYAGVSSILVDIGAFAY